MGMMNPELFLYPLKVYSAIHRLGCLSIPNFETLPLPGILFKPFLWWAICLFSVPAYGPPANCPPEGNMLAGN